MLSLMEHLMFILAGFDRDDYLPLDRLGHRAPHQRESPAGTSIRKREHL